MMMMQQQTKLRVRTVAFTSRPLPPFPFAFELAVASIRWSYQTNNRSHFHHPTDGASDADDESHQQREATVDCLSDVVVGGLVGFGV